MLIKEALEEIIERENLPDQYEVAKSIGVSQPTISNYKKGRTYPQLDIAALIYGRYGLRCEPFTEQALAIEWERLKKQKGWE